MNEWDNEPDKLEFEHAGFKCIILRHPESKHLCGYVELPKDHPYYGKSYNDIAVEVHGGLTYAGFRGEISHSGIRKSKGKWWIGFDCAHYGDFIPELAKILHREPRPDEHYRNIEYVRRELMSLAEQLTIEKIAEREFDR